MPISVNKDDAAKILGNLRAEYDAGLQHKRPKLKKWRLNDDRVNGNVKPPKRSLTNFHLPILAGFEDTLVSKVDEQPIIKFGSDQPGEVRLGRKYDALWRACSNRPGREWKMSDLSSKRDAARYGRALLKPVASSKPFNVDLMSIDPYDFYCDPLSGDRLSRARFLGVDAIFKSADQLRTGVKDGTYDKAAVESIVSGPPKDAKGMTLSESMVDAMSRFGSLQLDGYGYLGVGEKSYRLVESGTTFNGTRYYCVWSPEANVLLRCETLEEVYGIPEGRELWHIVSWAPFPDKKVFWGKAPDDDISDVAEFQRQTLMYASDGLVKNVWGTRVYDPQVFEAADLIFQPGGLAPSKKGSSLQGGGLAGAIHTLQAPQFAEAFNIVRGLDAFVGQKTGVTPDAQGTSNEQVLGIAQQNIEQVSDRMGLLSKQYQASYIELGQLFLYLAKKYLVGKEAVDIIGPEGYEFAELAAGEIDPSIAVTVKGGRAEETLSAVKRRDKTAALVDVITNPTLPKWAVEERLRLGGYEDAEIRSLTDQNAYGSNDQVNRANEAVEEILEGKQAKLYQGADRFYVEAVLKAAERYTASEGKEYDRLIAYAKAHIPIVGKNMASDLLNQLGSQMQPQQSPQDMPPPQMPTPPEQAQPQPAINPITQ